MNFFIDGKNTGFIDLDQQERRNQWRTSQAVSMLYGSDKKPFINKAGVFPLSSRHKALTTAKELTQTFDSSFYNGCGTFIVQFDVYKSNQELVASFYRIVENGVSGDVVMVQ